MTQELYHYTNILGLKAIIESRSIWASDIRYLNDFSEVKIAKDFLRATYPIILESYQNHPLANIIKIACEEILVEEITVFATSFCETPDKLSQWRGYANDGGGVSIGFNVEKLEKVSPLRLSKVKYGESIIYELEIIIKSFFNHKVKIKENEIKKDIKRQLIEHIVTSKSSAFSEESETRLIAFTHISKSQPVNYRVKNYQLVPYISIDLSEGFQDTIKSVWVGPTSSDERSIKSLREFLNYNTLGKTQLFSSSAPYKP